MFDRNVSIIPHVDRSPRYITVNETRAPTDESVRLLKEMESAAQSKVDQSIRVENCPFDCVVHFHNDFLNDAVRAKAILNLNGKQIVAEASVSNYEKKEIGPQILKAISDAVARECCDAIMCAAGRSYAI